MALDLDSIKARAAAAADPQFCSECGLRIATEEDFNTTKEGEGADLCWVEYGDCGVVFDIHAHWRDWYESDISALVAEVERLQGLLDLAPSDLEMRA